MPAPVTYRGMSLIVPDNDSEWREFYAHARAHRLVVRKCAACGLLRYPPTHACPTSFGFDGLLMSYCRTSPCSQFEK